MLGKLRNMTAIYLLKDDKMLLLYRQGSRVVNNLWTGSAGGHFEEFELNDARACVLRELYEEIGVSGDELTDLEMKYVTLRNTKGEIRQNYYFFARTNKDISLTSNEGVLKWFSLDELKDLEMPFTAKYVIEHYVSVGRNTDKLYGGVTTETGVVFTELEEF